MKYQFSILTIAIALATSLNAQSPQGKGQMPAKSQSTGEKNPAKLEKEDYKGPATQDPNANKKGSMHKAGESNAIPEGKAVTSAPGNSAPARERKPLNYGQKTSAEARTQTETLLDHSTQKSSETDLTIIRAKEAVTVSRAQLEADTKSGKLKGAAITEREAKIAEVEAKIAALEKANAAHKDKINITKKQLEANPAGNK